jgi:tRNA A37 threonylcarbamoyladenosine dehydratase
LARHGIGALTLIDLDHIAESNINRQVHALSETRGDGGSDPRDQSRLPSHPCG